MQLRCVIGSLRLGDGTEYSKGDIFSLDDEKSVQTFLQSGYVVMEPEQQQSVEPKVKVKRRGKRKR